jgi:dihydropteroate synthase
VQKTIQANGKIIDLTCPNIMGIVNVNADSFFSGSRVASIDQAVARTQQMMDEGATIIDVGAMSSRPGANIIDKDTELSTLHPVVAEIRHCFPNIVISIDTVHGAIVEKLCDTGIDMVNDISSGAIDSGMIESVAATKLPYVMMHMQGVPKTMQDIPTYDDVTVDILRYFVAKTNLAQSYGIRDIIIDPGFGFGKTIDHNFEILARLSAFQALGFPVLVGLSRKSFISKSIAVDTANALNGTTALHMVALQRGAKILRVHDVAEAKQCIDLYQKLVEYPGF